jgi:Dolichyl-phosphate-mannose-protein mannosyltransferase
MPEVAPRIKVLIIGSTVGLYLMLASTMALTKRPWCDEAWLATPALNLITTGRLSTTNLEGTGTWLQGIDQYTYWVMPLDLLAQAAWYRVVGFGLMPMRMLSILWGLVALGSWFVVVRRLTDRPMVALLTLLFTATDFIFVRGAGDGRMDMMNAALGFAALAAYLHWREQRLVLAIAISHTLAASSMLTHPNGLLPAAGLVGLAFYLDRRRLSLWYAGVAAVPYVLGFAAWGIYISQDPEMFLQQFGGNAKGRWQGVVGWISNTIDTYAAAFGLKATWAGSVVRLKALTLLAYLAGLAGVLLTSSLRRARGVRALFLLTAIYFGLMSLFHSVNSHDYLIHIVPMYAALLAIWLDWSWAAGRIPRTMLTAAAGGLVLLQVGGTVQRAILNPYQKMYMPVVDYLQQHASPDTLVMGSAELGFELGFTPSLIDDVRLGYLSNRRPDLIVVDDRYSEMFRDFAVNSPAVSRHVEATLANEFVKVYDREPYRIYARRASND